MLTANKIYNMEAIEFMKEIDSSVVDLVLCDLPYEVTQNDWDKKLNLKNFFQESWRVLKENGIIVLTSQQPFTTTLINAEPKYFKYNLIWVKSRPTGHLSAKLQPLRAFEEVCVFYKKQPTYNPILTKKSIKHIRKNNTKLSNDNINIYGKTVTKNRYDRREIPIDKNYPTNVLFFKSFCRNKMKHPTQKHVELFEWLVKTYSNRGDLVLDCTIGIGTTAIACQKNNRNFIGNDLNQEFVEIANQQLSQVQLNAFSNTQNSTSFGFPTENSSNISLKDNSNELSQISSNNETSLNNNIKRNNNRCLTR